MRMRGNAERRGEPSGAERGAPGEPARVAFIGLGVMGGPMAGHVAAAGASVTVYNRTAEKARAWADRHGGAVAATPREAAAGAQFVLCCVGDDDDLRAVTLGETGAFHALAPGAVFVDHTTASARIARELAHEAGARGAGCLDAPVSGGQAGAENGALTCMVGGEAADFARAEPVLAHYCAAARLMGPAGAGQLTKMVNQICIAGLVQGLAEGLHFARAVGLDPDAVFDAISKGAAGSWQMQNRWPTMAKDAFEFGFAVDWMRKDLAIVLDQARASGAHLPVTALVDQFYAQVQSLGGGRWDTSSLIAPLERTRKGE